MTSPNQPYPPGGQYPPPGGYGAPPGYGGMPPGPKPQNYLVWAILTTLFCCLPLGVVSIIFAAQVDGKWNSGDVAGAQNASDKARLFAIISAAAGVVAGVAYLIFVVAVLGTGSTLNY